MPMLSLGVYLDTYHMDKTPTHAGCIVFREEEGKKLYLVVSSSSGLHWVLPKGHIEEYETAEETALRELREEAGVIGEILRPLSIHSHIKYSGEEAIIQYYLMKAVRTVKPKEKRQIRWERKKSALELLSFDDARTALQDALDAIEKYP